MSAKKLFLCIILFVSFNASAMEPDGRIDLEGPRDSADNGWEEAAFLRAAKNAQRLKANNPPGPEVEEPTVELGWPVRKAITVTDPDVQAISNYLDQDTMSGDSALEDWNCGAPSARTYDGHNGLDIFSAPFAWYMMENDSAIIVAAAGGMIVDKVNDQPERSCTIDNNGGDNNLIVILHSDGSYGLYAHMRTGSITNKSIGDTVEKGDYLGVMGSAGLSTGPHLHLSVGFVEGLNLVFQDQWAGSCNIINSTSWWETQPPYYLPAILSIATHSASPVFPACPETETPNYDDTFSAGDSVTISLTLRDLLKDQVADIKVKQPNGTTFISTTFSDDVNEHSAAPIVWFSFPLPGNAMAGKWIYEVSFEGETVEHPFWVDAQPPGSNPPPASNNAYNGLFYDDGLEGEGYNIVTAEAGTVIYFYGSDSAGNRLWLISELVTQAFEDKVKQTIVMYESTGGVYSNPIESARGLSVWGTLELTYSSCTRAIAKLTGKDGEKTSSLVKLAGVPGTNCADPAIDEAAFSGLWFALNLEGEGFNLIVTSFGAVVYYYGFDKNGDRLWLIAGPFETELEIGKEVMADMFKANSGTFDNPVPSEQSLVKWGTVKIKVNSCSSMTFTMDTTDGDKVSASVRLANVTGLTCS